ncbi:hypothetical protein SYNPS1DRAFT_25189 [Syncephalis pseudoplumigaleata]|uniref:Uncharacterized protein n=1 Tax=Syncephalis pseudoplumigaleata TaxID=1712513 RepID=A0A4P9YU16_9FUNG|nr:hypothetical protein SYNPS1DRAFT_25189 [Syncephalis pseudoplumigaleata]|eukprot:RKP22882.1 hypothetical protein SYNPS1DRAFT_25189 [Syncephalis pseudoplumigaleata]
MLRHLYASSYTHTIGVKHGINASGNYQFAFGILAIAAIILSAVVLFLGTLTRCIHGDVAYARIPSEPQPDGDAAEDEDAEQNDDAFPAEDAASVLSSGRGDYVVGIKRRAKRINVDANIVKLVGSVVALSASTWGLLWQLWSHSHKYRASTCFLAMNALAWLYITVLSLLNLRYHKLARSKIGTHQTALVAIVCCCNVADITARYVHGGLESQLRETRCMLVAVLGAIVAGVGLLLTRGAVETTGSGRLRSLEESASIYEWISFSWMSPIMADSARHTLTNSDLWELPAEDQIRTIARRCEQHGQPFGTRLLFMACRRRILLQIAYGLLWSITLFAIPGFFYLLLDDLSIKSAADSHAWLYLTGLFASMIVSSVFYQRGFMEGHHIALQFKIPTGAAVPRPTS